MVGPEKASLSDVDRLRRHLLLIVRRAIAGVSGRRLVARALPEMWPRLEAALVAEQLFVIAVGKVAVPMATAWLDASGGCTVEGLVASPVGTWSGGGLEFFRVGHPVPTDASVQAGRRSLACAAAVPPRGVLLVLLSGGASASLAVPADSLTLQDKIAATDMLLQSGAPIDEINCVRKHLSQIKGGRLAAATAGTVVTLALSDVVGPVPDDPAVIGSGPTVGDPTTFAEAVAVVDRRADRGGFPSAARRVLEDGRMGLRPDTPKPGDAVLRRSMFRVVGSRTEAMIAAARTARRLGYTVATIDAPVVGEARVAATSHWATVRGLAKDMPRPACVISSGETTVAVRGPGRGGRNQEFALASVETVATATETMVLASVGTDGIDGPTDAAGAVVDPTTAERAERQGLGDPGSFLVRNDSYPFFERLGDLVRTGPTDTNVGDLQVVLIDDAED